MKLSLCITTYNRFTSTIKSFAKVINDARIDEIIIVDDASTNDSYKSLELFFRDVPKVKLFRNDANLGMSKNKHKSVSLASNEWCIVFDSDNVLSSDYLYNLPAGFANNTKTIYMPEKAAPNFDFSRFAGLVFDRNNVASHMHKSGWDVLFNTCNYVVPRDEYLKVFEPNDTMKGTDTLWFNYLWLNAGNNFNVVPNMEYNHVVHSGSGWLKDADYNLRKAAEINELIKQL